jgi:hypothetical protein
MSACVLIFFPRKSFVAYILPRARRFFKGEAARGADFSPARLRDGKSDASNAKKRRFLTKNKFYVNNTTHASGGPCALYDKNRAQNVKNGKKRLTDGGKYDILAL